MAVTDAFDVMTSARSYKAPISPAAARAELARCAGSQFDEAIVRAFLNVSLGRLRMAMGPLSWLTQLSFVPQALATAGASGATAVTAVVGLTAGALGAGLNEANPFSSEGTELSASAFPSEGTETSASSAQLTDDDGPSRLVSPGEVGGAGPSSTDDVPTPNGTSARTVGASTSTTLSAGPTTTTLPVPSTVTTQPPPASTRPAAAVRDDGDDRGASRHIACHDGARPGPHRDAAPDRSAAG